MGFPSDTRVSGAICFDVLALVYRGDGSERCIL